MPIRLARVGTLRFDLGPLRFPRAGWGRRDRGNGVERQRKPLTAFRRLRPGGGIRYAQPTLPTPRRWAGDSRGLPRRTGGRPHRNAAASLHKEKLEIDVFG